MDSAARHWLVEYFGCERAVLDDETRVRSLMRDAALAAGAKVVAEVFHRYAPQGVTGVVVIEESHLSVHTWPEYGYAAVDFFTCGDCLPERADRLLEEGFGATSAERMLVRRGLLTEPSAMRVEHHQRRPPR